MTKVENDNLFYALAKWERKFCFLPHRCNISKKIIWLTYAMKGNAREPWYVTSVETKWHRAKEHTMWLLRYDRSKLLDNSIVGLVRILHPAAIAHQVVGIQPITSASTSSIINIKYK